ncbi:MAG: hypothetical protein WD426_00645 [Anditalea sp.]
MHAEKLNSIKEARATLNLINLEIAKFPIGSPTRLILEQAAVVLESLIWKLVHKDLKEITTDLKQHQSKLKKLNQEMDAANSSLSKITAMIEKVSQMIGTLASLVCLLIGMVIYGNSGF